MKKIITLGIVIIMLLALSACNQNNTPEKAAESFVVSLHTADAEKLVDCIPEFMLRQMAQSYGVSSDNKKELINAMKSSVSNENIPECVVTDVKKADDSALVNEYKENLSSYGVTNEDLSKIEEYCMVSVEAKLDSEEIKNIVFCLKYDGKWCAVDID